MVALDQLGLLMLKSFLLTFERKESSVHFGSLIGNVALYRTRLILALIFSQKKKRAFLRA
jgi:hypothetical protein